jgi:hypothetical protein
MKRYYGTVQESTHGKFAVQIPVEYEFFGSGVIMPPTISVQLWGAYPVEFVFNDGQAELGKTFGHDQQSISRYLKEGQRLQEMVSAGSYNETDIWGFSPTDKRRRQYSVTDLLVKSRDSDTERANAPSATPERGNK